MNENFNSLPEEERPYERCMRHGAGQLSDRELLAVLLRTGAKGRTVLELAGELLKLVPEREGFTGLRRMSLEELSAVKGIGKVKAVQLKCVLELARRMAREESGAGIYFKTPASVAEYYMEDMRHKEQEVLLLLMLDQKGRLLREKYIFKGTVNASMISPREIFLEALSSRAVQIILLHNHPSGDASPSKEDRNVTRRIQEAGRLLGITLTDHIIIGERTYVSFREEQEL
ncbi:MAG: DNA repair protein RadC [Lachnospiraceae bacterium]|nr:DNA repair protein RadC [Lachnospiraceae bacterium]